tara:strand:+ start:2679 stop:3767 length:1089 start_codon:yes stop_codon:yes gene_type:complete
LEYKDIRIITEEAKNIKKFEWEDIVNFIKKFDSISDSSHNSAKNHDLEYFKIKLLKSPYGSCYITRVVNNEGKCMGFQSLTKKSFFYLGKKIDSFELGDVYLESILQGRSIYLKMIKDSMDFLKKIFPKSFVYATANKFSQPWLIRGGFKLTDFGLNFRILPIKPFLVLKSKLLIFVFSLLNPLYVLLLKVFLYFFSFNNKISFDLIDNFNEFPQDYKPIHDIEMNRSKEYLQWRFIQNPLKYEIFKIKYIDNAIGYIIFKKALYKKTPTLFLADISINKDYIHYTQKIFLKILFKHYNLSKYAFIASCLSNKSYYWKSLSQCLPINFSKIPFIIHENLAPESSFNYEKAKIHFVFGDGDNI